jgi:hypothetical protein
VNIQNLSLADVIGIWGGFVATIVLVWDIAKWVMSGPRIHFRVQGGMQTINYPGLDGKSLISAHASNYGDRPVTITNLGLIHYKSLFHKALRKPDMTAVIGSPSDSQPLPYLLNPGVEWMGLADQTPDVYEMAIHGRLYMILYHSHRDGSVWKRVKFGKGYSPKPNQDRSR